MLIDLKPYTLQITNGKNQRKKEFKEKRKRLRKPLLRKNKHEHIKVVRAN